MALPIGPVLGVLADNLRKRGSVMPLGQRKAVGWADGLDLPRGGDPVLYTGHLYQLMPAIASLEEAMASYEESWMRLFFGVGRMLNRAVNLSGLMAREKAAVRAVFERRLANIARLLRAAGVAFGYLYERELYSGALLHDQAVDDAFESHARRVAGGFRQAGVNSVITVDPHTTHMLRSVYPKVVPGFELQVQSYLEVLAAVEPEPKRMLDIDLVIHDSCVYARYEEVTEEPRALLERAGARIREPEFSRKRTLCCGGPIESLFPSRARSICEKRVAQLARAGGRVAAMCPICLLNLEHAVRDHELEVRDVSEYLADAYCDPLPGP